jgi:hypothetical protein
MSSVKESEASKTSGFIAIGGFFVAAIATTLFYVGTRRASLAMLAAGGFVALWGLFLAMAVMAALWAEDG